MSDFFYETPPEKYSERCMFIVQLILSSHDLTLLDAGFF